MNNEPEKSIEFQEKINGLIGSGLNLMEERYGRDFDQPEKKKKYHTRKHVEDVIRFVELMGRDAVKDGTITERQFQILRLAAAWHDVESDKPEERPMYLEDGEPTDRTNDMETVSADMLEKEMRKDLAFTEDDIKFARKLIMATKELYLAPGVMKQVAEDGDEIDKLMSDADTGNIGMDYEDLEERFTVIAKEFGFMARWEHEGKTGDSLLMELYRWQAKFLSDRYFLSEYGKNNFGKTLEVNKKILADKIKILEQRLVQ